MTEASTTEKYAISEKQTLYCSFCGASQHEVKKLISGPAVFICDECALNCLGIVIEDNLELIQEAVELIDAAMDRCRNNPSDPKLVDQRISILAQLGYLQVRLATHST